MFLTEFDTCDEAAAKAARTALLDYLRREAGDDPEMVEVEAIYLELVGNVCKHAGRWATVALRWRSDGTAVLEISDHGPGLDLSHWQAPAQLCEHGRGLMIVSKLCQGIDITAGPGGSGTTVRAILPVRRRIRAA